MQRVIRLKELVGIVGLRRSAIYNMVRSGRFPRQVLIGQRAVAWREGDVEAWIAGRPVAGVGDHCKGPPQAADRRS